MNFKLYIKTRIYYIITRDMLRRSLVVFILAACSFLYVSGCDKPDAEEPPVADEKHDVLFIGLLPEQNIFEQILRYKPLADYLYKRTGIKIELRMITRYGDIIDNFKKERLDGAFFGSFTYTLAHEKLGVETLVRPEKADGTSTYYGMIMVRKDSGIRNAADMKGKVFAFVDRTTTAGFLLPLYYFKKNGIKDYRTYFRETYFAGTHEDVIRDVMTGKADIGAAKNTIYDMMVKADRRIEEEVMILDRSPDVPENGLALKKTVRESVRDKIRDTLLAMHDDAEGADVLRALGFKRFIVNTDKDYAPVYDYARKAGIDYSVYNYRNK